MHLQGFELLPHVNIIAVCNVRWDVVAVIADKCQAQAFSVSDSHGYIKTVNCGRVASV